MVHYESHIDVVLGVPTTRLEQNFNAHFTRQQLCVLRSTYDKIPTPLTIQGFEHAISTLGGGTFENVVIALPSLNFQQVISSLSLLLSCPVVVQ